MPPTGVLYSTVLPQVVQLVYIPWGLPINYCWVIFCSTGHPTFTPCQDFPLELLLLLLYSYIGGYAVWRKAISSLWLQNWEREARKEDEGRKYDFSVGAFLKWKRLEYSRVQ